MPSVLDTINIPTLVVVNGDGDDDVSSIRKDDDDDDDDDDDTDDAAENDVNTVRMKKPQAAKRHLYMLSANALPVQ